MCVHLINYDRHFWLMLFEIEFGDFFSLQSWCFNTKFLGSCQFYVLASKNWCMVIDKNHGKFSLFKETKCYSPKTTSSSQMIYFLSLICINGGTARNFPEKWVQLNWQFQWHRFDFEFLFNPIQKKHGLFCIVRETDNNALKSSL